MWAEVFNDLDEDVRRLIAWIAEPLMLHGMRSAGSPSMGHRPNVRGSYFSSHIDHRE
jgi:hypothetical protein